MGFPLLAQVAEGLFGQGHVTIPLAFAGADVQEQALGINVANLQAQAFAQAQAAGINRDQGHAMIEGRNLLEDQPYFLGGQDDGQLKTRIGTDQLDFGGPEAAEEKAMRSHLYY